VDIGLVLVDQLGNVDPKGWQIQKTNSVLQMKSGGGRYEDEAEPWSMRMQEDWAGGRGSVDLNDIDNKYFDGYRINTLRDRSVVLSGWDFYGTGVKSQDQYWNAKLTLSEYRRSITPDVGMGLLTKPWISTPFTASASYTMTHIWLWLKVTGTPGVLNVYLYSDDNSAPDSSLASTTVARTAIAVHTNNTNYNLYKVPLSYALVSGTAYHVVLKYDAADEANYWNILGAYDVSAGHSVMSSTDGSTWATVGSGNAIYYRITGARVDAGTIFFEYKDALFVVTRPHDGSVSKLYIQGDQGVVKTGSTKTSVTIASGSAIWAADEAIGCVMKIVAGTGSTQIRPFSLITDNGATNTGETNFTVSFDVAPGSDSEVVIVGSNKWTALDTTTAPADHAEGGAGWAAGEQARNVLVVNHAVYFAMGDSVPVSRMRRYNASGTWTNEWNDESSSYGWTYLMWANDNRGNWIWGAKGGYPSQMRKAAMLDASGSGAVADLTWVGEAEVDANVNTGDVGQKVKSMIRYGEQANLHVCKEDSIIQWLDERFWPVGIHNMGIGSDYRNGIASCVHQGALYVSYKDTIMMWFEGSWLNVGPGVERNGLPSNRRGFCRRMFSREDTLFAAWDAGESGYSTIMARNGQGWTELYRAPDTGMEIQDVYLQNLPGDHADLLHFGCGNELVSMYFERDPNRFPYDTNNYHAYNFGISGHIDTPWIYFDQNDADKLFDTIRAINNYKASSRINISYRIDDEDDEFTHLGIITQFQDSLAIDSTFSTRGRRIQFRITLESSATYQSPELVLYIVKALVLKDINTIVVARFKLDRDGTTLGNGNEEGLTASYKRSVLNGWAELAEGVYVTSQNPEIQGGYNATGAYYKLDYPEVIETKENNETHNYEYICTMTMYRL
jgi:hypothetical protein